MKKRWWLARLGVALGFAALGGCADGERAYAPTGSAIPTRAPVVTGAPPRGLRVDLGGQAHHARGLVRQADGSYRATCVDAPDGSLRVREGARR